MSPKRPTVVKAKSSFNPSENSPTCGSCEWQTWHCEVPC